jgi:hypothetical protein
LHSNTSTDYAAVREAYHATIIDTDFSAVQEPKFTAFYAAYTCPQWTAVYSAELKSVHAAEWCSFRSAYVETVRAAFFPAVDESYRAAQFLTKYAAVYSAELKSVHAAECAAK